MTILTFLKNADIFDYSKLDLYLGLEKGTIESLVLNEATTDHLPMKKLEWFFKTLGITGPWISLNTPSNLTDGQNIVIKNE